MPFGLRRFLASAWLILGVEMIVNGESRVKFDLCLSCLVLKSSECFC